MTLIDAITCDLDFDLEGKHFGNIDLSVSDNKHAFDKIPIPVVSIKNGSGPTLLLSAGNHGDEYEGQVILRRLIHELSPSDINGRLIIMPALNYPAVLDDARVSPLDRGNLNRSFPGIDGGSPTAAIAHFVTSNILPLADAGVDLHSGGWSAYYLPSAFLCTAGDPAITRQNLELVEAFNAPYTFVVRGEDAASGFDPVANRLGIPFVSAELGGAGRVDKNAVEIGITGVKNIMQHLGIISAQPDWQPRTRFLNGIDDFYFLSAPFSGIFEPSREVGEQVDQGDIAGRLFSLEEVERPPLALAFTGPGTILVKRNAARLRRGGHLFLVAGEMDLSEVPGLA